MASSADQSIPVASSVDQPVESSADQKMTKFRKSRQAVNLTKKGRDIPALQVWIDKITYHIKLYNKCTDILGTELTPSTRELVSRVKSGARHNEIVYWKVLHYTYGKFNDNVFTRGKKSIVATNNFNNSDWLEAYMN